MPYLQVQQPGEDKSEVTLEAPLLRMGRSVKNDLCLHNDPSASRFHAEIEQRDGRFYLRDIGSRHGTALNGRPINDEQALGPGDRIVIGRTVLTFVGDGSSLSEPTPAQFAETDGSMNTMMLDVSDMVQSTRALSSDSGTTDAGAVSPHVRAFAILTEAASDLLSNRPLAEVLELVMDLVWKASNPDRASLMLLEGEPATLKVRVERSTGDSTESIRMSRTIADVVLKDGQAVLMSDADDQRFAGAESIFMEQIRSAMCAPLWDNNGIIGLVYADRRSLTQTYARDDLQVLGLVANVAAVKIENCRLFLREQQMLRVEQELTTAARIQGLLLPSSPPELEGYEVTGINRQCRTVGGDYYDWQREAEDRLVLAIGDVSGKGIGAALLMATVQATFRAHVGAVDSLRELVSRLNRTVLDSSGDEQFLTFFCSALQPSTGLLRFVNAGHNPPLLLRPGGDVEELRTGGIVLGILPSVEYELREVVLGPGDVLVLFSDGITETSRPDGEEFGEQRLIDVLREHEGRPIVELQDRVLEAVAVFAGDDAEQFDDMTLVLLRRR